MLAIKHHKCGEARICIKVTTQLKRFKRQNFVDLLISQAQNARPVPPYS